MLFCIRKLIKLTSSPSRKAHQISGPSGPRATATSFDGAVIIYGVFYIMDSYISDTSFYIVPIFITAFLINVCWEIFHSRLYTTCLTMKGGPLMKLLIKMSFKDAFWISLFYVITVFIFQNIFILNNPLQILLFSILALLFSFIDEGISVRLKRWEYSPKMPIIFGVGVTPLFELAVTGLATFIFIFYLF